MSYANATEEMFLAKIADLTQDNQELENEKTLFLAHFENDKRKIADLTRTNSALEVLVDAKQAKIAELQSEAVNWSQLVESCQQTGINQMHKIAELNRACENHGKRYESLSNILVEGNTKIVELEEMAEERRKRAVKYHQMATEFEGRMLSCAVELQDTRIMFEGRITWDYVAKLDKIIKKLRGED